MLCLIHFVNVYFVFHIVKVLICCWFHIVKIKKKKLLIERALESVW